MWWVGAVYQWSHSTVALRTTSNDIWSRWFLLTPAAIKSVWLFLAHAPRSFNTIPENFRACWGKFWAAHAQVCSFSSLAVKLFEVLRFSDDLHRWCQNDIAVSYGNVWPTVDGGVRRDVSESGSQEPQFYQLWTRDVIIGVSVNLKVVISTVSYT